MSFPEIGQPAPSIQISEWISREFDEEKDLSGKNIILEFWGTRCGPCVAAIPHFNELVEKYGSKDTVFISLAHEDSFTVKRFLEKRPIKGIVAIDNDGATFNSYGIRGIPHTVLVDSKSLLRWHGHPNLFTEELLSNFIETDEVPDIDQPSTTPETVSVSTSDTLFSLTIDRNTSGRIESSSSGNDETCKVKFIGWQVIDIIRSLLDHPQTRMRIEGDSPEDKLDVELHSSQPLKPETAKQRAVDILCDTYGITINRIMEKQDGWKLTCSQPTLSRWSRLLFAGG